MKTTDTTITALLDSIIDLSGPDPTPEHTTVPTADEAAADQAAAYAEYAELEQAAATWEARHPVVEYSEYDAEAQDEMDREAHLMPDLSGRDAAPATGPFVETDGWDAYRPTSFAALGYRGSRLA